MPLLAHALFYFAYVLVALATALALARIGGSDGAAATLGGIALFAACAVTHGAVMALYSTATVKSLEASLKGQIEKLRASEREARAELDAVLDRIDRMEERVAEAEAITERRLSAPPAPPEVKALEQLVDKLGKTLDVRFEEMRRLGPGAQARPDPTRGPVDLVREALRESRVELHLQPVVALPQRRTAFYEGFTRLKDANGRIIPPAEFLPAAEAAGIVSTIDNALLFRCVQIVRKLSKQDRRIGIFCNISPRSLSDELFFPQFLDFMRENRDLAGALIFELPQEAFEARTSVEARAMGRLVDIGFRFSIDKVSRLDLDLQDLERAGVRFVKAAGQSLLEEYGKRGVRPRSTISREIEARDVAAVFQRFGIDLIAERVEAEDMLLELLDLDIPFAQGHLFGHARPIKDSLMEETAPPKGYLTRDAAARSA